LSVLIEGLKNLNVLIIEDDDWELYMPIDAVLALGSNLQRLDLRPETLSFSVHQGARLEVISVAQLVQLQNCCPNLAFLCLTLSVFSCEVSTKPPTSTWIQALETMADRSKVDEFLNVLSQFERLRRLILYAVSSLAPQGVIDGLSDDADFDGAQAIMTKLHAQKVGLQFHSIEIHLHHYGGPNVFGEHEIKSRSFASKISVSGVYQQWGSSRKVDPRVLVGSASN
jgi:hypothetical protein